jgi:4-hydroxyphenylacetate 3-hydroxylase, reductase component
MSFTIEAFMTTAHSKRFRNALGAFATGVTIVTTKAANGHLIGTTASSFNSVSLDPPLVLWSLANTAMSFKTYMSAEYFAVNVLKDDAEEMALRFAKSGTDKWRDVPHHTGITGSPILDNALAVFECRKRHAYDGGDHVIFVGEVLNFTERQAGKPLLYWGGDFYRP